MPITYYTQEEYDKLKEERNILNRVFDDYIRKLPKTTHKDKTSDEQSVINPTGKKDENYYTFINKSPREVLEALIIVRQALMKDNKISDVYDFNKKGFTFVDAGSGYGFNMALARSVGFIPRGIELDKGLCEKSMCKHAVKNANILRCSYKKYDVVYYYHPIYNHDLQTKFEKKVEDELKVGGYIIPVMKRSIDIMYDNRFEELKGKMPFDFKIFKKVRKTKK